jgi:hypothetical protein
VPPRDLCARCGGAIDRATRRNSGYCSDECREERRGAILRARRVGDAWGFALGPLYSALGPVDGVRLMPADRARVEERPIAHLGPVVSSGDRRARAPEATEDSLLVVEI